jgi:hypothetical protein
VAPDAAGLVRGRTARSGNRSKVPATFSPAGGATARPRPPTRRTRRRSHPA